MGLSTIVRKELGGFYEAPDFLNCVNSGEFEVRYKKALSFELCAFDSPDCPHSPCFGLYHLPQNADEGKPNYVLQATKHLMCSNN